MLLLLLSTVGPHDVQKKFFFVLYEMVGCYWFNQQENQVEPIRKQKSYHSPIMKYNFAILVSISLSSLKSMFHMLLN